MSTAFSYKCIKLLFNVGIINQFRLKSYYITTPIFYVNASPHIGHLYTTAMADAGCRWKLLKGLDAKLVTGTDEHGLKVLQAAEKNNLNVDEYCTKVSKRLVKMFVLKLILFLKLPCYHHHPHLCLSSWLAGNNRRH